MPEVQILEPTLCLYDAAKFQGLYESTFATLSKSVDINLVTFYDDVGECFEWVSNLPVKAVSLDFCGVVRSNNLHSVTAYEPCSVCKFLQFHWRQRGRIAGPQTTRQRCNQCSTVRYP